MTLVELAPYLLIGLILLINITLWKSFLDEKERPRMNNQGKAGFSFQKPWEKEEAEFRELNERVKSLTQNNQGSETKNHSDAEVQNLDNQSFKGNKE